MSHSARRFLASSVVVVIAGLSGAWIPAAAATAAPSGGGIAEVQVGSGSCPECFGVPFDAQLSGAFTLGGALQTGSLSIQVSINYDYIASQNATSETVVIPANYAFLSGSTTQGERVSGWCGGTVSVGGVTVPSVPALGIGTTFIIGGPFTAQLDCNPSLGGGPVQPMSISIAAVATDLGAVGAPIPVGVGTYTSS